MIIVRRDKAYGWFQDLYVIQSLEQWAIKWIIVSYEDYKKGWVHLQPNNARVQDLY